MKWIVGPKDTGFENGLARTTEDMPGPGKGDFSEPEGVMICISPCGCLSMTCPSQGGCTAAVTCLCVAGKEGPEELMEEPSEVFESLVSVV